MNHVTKVTPLSIALILCLLSNVVRASDKLLLVTFDYPPYEYVEEGQAKGVAVNVVREALQRLDQNIEIAFYPWARSLKMVETGAADGIFTAYKTEEREKFLDYSSEVLIPQEVSLFVHKESQIQGYRSLSDLSQYDFAIRFGISHGKKFDQAVKNKVLPNIHKSNSGYTTIRLLLKKRVDLLVFDRLDGYYHFHRMGASEYIRELSPPLQSVPSYIAFSKKKGHTELRDRLDQVLREMKQDGTYQRLTNYPAQIH